MSSLSKVFVILESVISSQNTGLGFAEVVLKTGLPKASVHRILKELTGMGYLIFTPETKKYRGGLKLAHLGSEVMAHFELRDYAHPFLLELNRKTDHTCHLGISDGDVGVYVDKIETHDYGIKLFSSIGKSFLLHCTGLGKVLLAWSDPKDINALLAKPLKAFTDRTLTDPQALLAELETIRKEGYAVDREEITRSIMCVAAPVFGLRDNCIAAVSATFPAYLNEERGIIPEIEAVCNCAEAISGKLLGRNGSEEPKMKIRSKRNPTT